jgi:hypothetical protein
MTTPIDDFEKEIQTDEFETPEIDFDEIGFDPNCGEWLDALDSQAGFSDDDLDDIPF